MIDSMRIIAEFQADEYVTAIEWDRQNKVFGVTTAAGRIISVRKVYPPQAPLAKGDKKNKKIVVQKRDLGEPIWTERILRLGFGDAVGAIGFSGNGQYLAAAGQTGQVWIWDGKQLVEMLDFSGCWIDHLVWHPLYPSRLAIATGKQIVIWNANTQIIEHTLDFAESSVLGLSWTNLGDRLTASGNRVVKTWEVQDWNQLPKVLELESASGAIAWSQADRYFAAGNFDRTVLVAEPSAGQDGEVWRMRGFPVKVTAIAWSYVSNPSTYNSSMTQNPILATVSGDGVVLWNRYDDEADWVGEVAIVHEGRVNAIAWHPKLLILVSAGSDGRICLWEAGTVKELIAGEMGWTTIAWSEDGNFLVAGSDQGAVVVCG